MTEKSKVKPFEVHAGGDLAQFFARHNVSLIATAYKSNQVFSFGATKDGRVSCFYSTHNHPMALGLSKRADCLEVWVGTKHHLIRCADAGEKYNESNEASGGGGNFTATLVPRILHAVGDQQVHGIYATTDETAPFFTSTNYSALCKLNIANPEVTVDVVWRPPFISEIRCEDRCHLNDVCFVNGKPKYASCVCESDAVDGWRDHRASGGVIVDVETGKIIATGLSMPHSPRWYKGELWVLESGTGQFGNINIDTGEFHPRVFLPGFLRGVQFVDRFAIVGSSLDRHETRFSGLELGKTIEKKKTTPMCGFFVIDMATWSIVHKLELKYGDIHELYDILLVPGHRARVLGLNDEEGSNMVKVRDAVVADDPQKDDD